MTPLNLVHFVDVEFEKSLASCVGSIGTLDLIGVARGADVFFRTIHNGVELYRGPDSYQAAEKFNEALSANK